MTTKIMVGHVLDRLADLPDESVHMAWSSVPYWGLRSYDTPPQVWGGDPDCAHAWGTMKRGKRKDIKAADETTSKARLGVDERQSTANLNGGNFCSLCNAWHGEHGLEPSFGLWLEHEVEIFREIRRVLRKDGTVWLNCGDAYATAPNGRSANAQKDAGTDDRTFRDKPFSTATGIFKSKDRLLMPARLAIALHEDGWYLRDEIIWHKLNPMPSSIADRTTPAHEMLYVFTKAPRYFYDSVAIHEPVAVEGWDDGSRVFGGTNKNGANAKHARTTGRRGYKRPDGWDTGSGAHGTIHRNGREKGEPDAAPAANTRRKRSVWPLASEPFPGAHFATAPTALVRPCILAGTSQKGVCSSCGAPWVRQVETNYENPGNRTTNGPRSLAQRHETAGFAVRLEKRVDTTGWAPSCACPDNVPVPATILDPFGGSGTTGLVAEELGRDAVLIELNPSYARIARARIKAALHRVETPDLPEETGEDLPLFATGAAP